MSFKMGKRVTLTASDLGLPEMPPAAPGIGARVQSVEGGMITVGAPSRVNRWDTPQEWPPLDIAEAFWLALDMPPPKPRPTLWPASVYRRLAGHRWTNRCSREMGRALGWRVPPQHRTEEQPNGWGCL